MNEGVFLDDSVCLCEMFTSPGCSNRKRIEINCFTCPPGGTKRNWFNLEERRFWLDVRKNFLTEQKPSSGQCVLNRGLSRRGSASICEG